MSSHEIDTIVLGVPCTIKYDYQPYEAADTGPEAMYPGCDEEIEVTDVLVGNVSVMDWVDNWKYEIGLFDIIEEAVQEHLIRQREQYLEDRVERYLDYEYGNHLF